MIPKKDLTNLPPKNFKNIFPICVCARFPNDQKKINSTWKKSTKYYGDIHIKERKKLNKKGIK